MPSYKSKKEKPIINKNLEGLGLASTRKKMSEALRQLEKEMGLTGKSHPWGHSYKTNSGFENR